MEKNLNVFVSVLVFCIYATPHPPISLTVVNLCRLKMLLKMTHYAVQLNDFYVSFHSSYIWGSS